MNQAIQPAITANGDLLTGPFLGSFVHVVNPHQFGENEPAYSVEMLFDKADPTIQMLGAMAKKAATDKWGANIPTNFRSPIRDGDTKADQYPEMGGKFYVKASTKKRKPLVIDREKVEILDAGVVYSGAIYRAIVSCYAYSVNGNNGVSFGLSVIQKLEDGNPLSGGTATAAMVPDLPPAGGGGMVPDLAPAANIPAAAQQATQQPAGGVTPATGGAVDLNSF